MKKFTFLFAILICSLQGLFAQGMYDIRSPLDFFNSYKMQGGSSHIILNESDVEGSPFLTDEFTKGTIYTYQNIRYDDVPLRYNIYNDNMEFQTPDEQIMAIATPEIIEKAAFGEYTFSNIPYKYGNRIKRGFFVPLAEGTVSVYSKYEIKYIEAKEAAAYKDPEPAKFVKYPNLYYLRYKEEAAVKVESKKDLQDFFPDHQKKVESFIRQNKVKPSKEDRLLKLVEYYNSL